MTRRQQPKRKAEPQSSGSTWRLTMVKYVTPIVWTALVATAFFLLSNPLVFIEPFDHSLEYTVLFTAGVCVILFPWLRAPRMPFEVLLFLSFCALSSLWSLDETTTWKGVVVYGAVTLIALVIGANAGRAILVEGLAWGGVAVVLGSWYAWEERLPGAGVLDSVGVLAGVGTNRNILGYTLVLALCAAVSDVPRAWWRRVLRIVAVVTILVGIHLSGSATGLLGGVVVLAAAGLIAAAQHWLPNTSAGRRRALVTGGLVVFVLAIASVNQVAALLGRESSFSGRVPFWDATLGATSAHHGTWFGFGWSAVWPHPWLVAPENEVVDDIYTRAGASLTHGHNSLFDLIPQVGIVGAVLALAILVRALVRGIRSLGIGPDRGTPGTRAAARFLVLGVVGQVVLGLTEPLLTIPLGWFCAILLAQLPAGEASTGSSTPASAPVGGKEPAAVVAAAD